MTLLDLCKAVIEAAKKRGRWIDPLCCAKATELRRAIKELEEEVKGSKCEKSKKMLQELADEAQDMDMGY